MAIFDWLRNWQREQQRKAAEREAAAKREAERRIQAAMEAARRETERKAREEREKPTTETPDVPIVIIGGPRGGGGAPAYSITLAADDATVSGAQGTTVDINLTVTRNNGFTGTVSLAVTGLPSGVSGAFSDSSLSSGETTSTLTLTIDIAAGLVTADVFVITASASGVSDSTVNGTVTVTAASDFPAGAFWEEDFDDYADTTALRAQMPTGLGSGTKYQYCFEPTAVDLETTVTYQGKKTMRFTQSSSFGETPQIGSAFGNPLSPDEYDGIWWRSKVRFSSGWTTSGSGPGAASYKWLALGLTGPDSSRGMIIHQMSDWAPELMIDDSSIDGGPLIGRPGGLHPETSDNNWYDVIVFAKRYSDTRGRLRMWFAIDGTTPVEQFDLDDNPNPSVAMGRFFGFSFGRNFNKFPPSSPQYIYWGPAAFYDESVYSNPFGLSGV